MRKYRIHDVNDMPPPRAGSAPEPDPAQLPIGCTLQPLSLVHSPRSRPNGPCVLTMRHKQPHRISAHSPSTRGIGGNYCGPGIPEFP